jgi:integrase
LWWSEVSDPEDRNRKIRTKTKRHPDRGGNKDAKRWLAVWTGPDGKEATKAFHVKDTAKKYARRQEEDIERGEYIDPAAGKELLGALGRKWLRLRDVGGQSRVKYERIFRLHIEPAFGHRQAKAPRPSEVAEWLQALSKTHGQSVQEQALFILRGIFSLAVADGLRKDNPAKSDVVGKPRARDEAEAEEREVWSADRAWAVILAHPEEYRAIPTASAGCGLRESEAFALAEEDFDFEAGKVRIGRQVVQVGKTWAFKLPKGGRAREVPLPSGVARAIQAHIEAHPPRPYELPWMKENGDIAKEPHVCRLLFRWQGEDPRTHDQHIRPRAYAQSVWTPALAEAGVIPMPEPGPRGGLSRHFQAASKADGTHALRHFYSTTLQDAGVALGAVMDFLGHSRRSQRRVPITIRVYGHTTEAAFEAARNAIDRSLFRLRPVHDQLSNGAIPERAASQ